MIRPFEIPLEHLGEEALIDMATKLNEVISEINKSKRPSREEALEKDLYDLIESWKKEAAQLEDRPDLYPPNTRETCLALAREKRRCSADLIQLIEEHKQ